MFRNCRATAVTDFEMTTVISETGEHTHDTDDYAVQLGDFYQSLRDGGSANLQTPGQLLLDASASRSEVVQALFASRPACLARIRRARRKAGHYITEIESERDLPLKYQVTLGNDPQPFFFGRLECQDGHGLAFTTLKNLKDLANSMMWYCDGVFKYPEKPYMQLYVIHGTLEGDLERKSRPLFHFIMNRKSGHIYETMFSFIKHQFAIHGIELKTEFVMMDFEIGVKSALDRVFDKQLKVVGCSYHLRQNVIKKAKTLDIKASREEDLKAINRICTLPFLPPEMVRQKAKDLKAKLITNKCHYRLFCWFYNNYIASNALFKDMYNTYALISKGLPTTNNYCEGYFNSMSHLLGSRSVKLFTVISMIVKIQSITDGARFRLGFGNNNRMLYLERARQAVQLVENTSISSLDLIDRLNSILRKPAKHSSDKIDMVALDVLLKDLSEIADRGKNSLNINLKIYLFVSNLAR